MPELCILCGAVASRFVPNAAKKSARRRAASQAVVEAQAAGGWFRWPPRLRASFPELRPAQLIHALKGFGFLRRLGKRRWGAQEVFGAGGRTAADGSRSRAVLLGLPDCGELFAEIPARGPRGGSTPLLSPLLTHCKMLRQNLRPGHRHCVYRSPASPKKLEGGAAPRTAGTWRSPSRICGAGWNRKKIAPAPSRRYRRRPVLFPKAAAEGDVVSGGWRHDRRHEKQVHGERTVSCMAFFRAQCRGESAERAR